MRSKVNIALAFPIITAVHDKKASKRLTCPVGAAFQHWSAATLILTCTQQQLSGAADTLRSESDREGLSFVLPVYGETPVQKATERLFTTLSEPAVQEQRGGEDEEGQGQTERQE